MNAPRPQPLVDSPLLAERAAELLCSSNTVLPLTPEEAADIVSQMVLIHYLPNTTVLREGDGSRSNYMLLLLDGQVAVDGEGTGPHDAVAVGVVGAGSIIGEMALLDGAPRSATCTALSAVQAAGMSRSSLERLVDERPRAAAKLLAGLANGISSRLRGLSDQLNLYADLTARLQAEVEQLRRPSS